MKSISKLKDEARKYEQREEWEKAIQAYLQVLRVADEGEAEVELPLYNRLGDLCVRLGKPQEAMRHYEQAADRYAEAGLYNNAIALCNKALRYNPDRLELVRKLGQFSASQGFITDARRYFLDYAERQFKGGKVTEALGALEDFANVSDDPEIREMLGRQLHAHGRINDAVDELRRAHAMRLREGDTERADTIRAEIMSIDPHAIVGDGAAAPADARSRGPADLPGFVDVAPTPAPVEVEPPPLEIENFEDDGTPAIEGLESEGMHDGDLGDVEPVELAGFEGLSDLDLVDIDTGGGSGIDGLETTTLDFGEIEESPPALEDLGIEREDTSFGTGDESRDAETFDLPTLDDPAGSFDLPTLDDPGETFDLPPIENESESFDLPLLGDDEPSAPGAEESDATLDGAAGPFEVPDSAGSGSDGLGGDLPLDLSSFGDAGSSPFDLPTFDDEASDSTEWKDGPSFDLPTIDNESLGLPTWEVEPDATFDLPTFETPPVADEPVDDEPVDGSTLDRPASDTARDAPRNDPADVADQPAAETATDASANAGATSQASSTDSAPPAPTMIPAIELPTWETGPVPEPVPEWIDETVDDTALGDTEEPAYEAPTEPAEPSWVEPVPDTEEDAGPDLPTFTYEDDDAGDGVATVDDEEPDTGPVDLGGIDRAEAPASDEDDPLGLAAHLAGHVPPQPLREPLPAEPSPVGARDSAWLDEIADDEPEVLADVAPDEPEIDAAADLTGIIEGAHDIAAGDAAPPSDVEQAAAVGKVPPAGDNYIDLGAFLTGDDEEVSTRFRVQETAPTGDEDRDFAELLSQFKSKVQEHLPPEDAAAHYDLGLAFKEMGLFDEAIGEFQIALRAGHMRLRVYEELGQCFLEKEQYTIAAKVLSRALEMKFDDELELLGVYYHLGRAYEALGRRDEARDAYERVLGMDINFGDVTDRLARL